MRLFFKFLHAVSKSHGIIQKDVYMYNLLYQYLMLLPTSPKEPISLQTNQSATFFSLANQVIIQLYLKLHFKILKQKLSSGHQQKGHWDRFNHEIYTHKTCIRLFRKRNIQIMLVLGLVIQNKKVIFLNFLKITMEVVKIN